MIDCVARTNRRRASPINENTLFTDFIESDLSDGFVYNISQSSNAFGS